MASVQSKYPWLGIAVVVALAAGVFGGVALAQTEADQFTGCLSDRGDLERVAIGDSPVRPCKSKHTQVTWAAEGPSGPPGTAEGFAVFNVNLDNDGDEAVVATNGPLSLVARCSIDPTGIDRTQLLVRSSVDGWATDSSFEGFVTFLTVADEVEVAGRTSIHSNPKLSGDLQTPSGGTAWAPGGFVIQVMTPIQHRLNIGGHACGVAGAVVLPPEAP